MVVLFSYIVLVLIIKLQICVTHDCRLAVLLISVVYSCFNDAVIVGLTHLLMISGPLMTLMWAPTSLATARPIMVFPEPGGPYSSSPRGGGIPVWQTHAHVTWPHQSQRFTANVSNASHDHIFYPSSKIYIYG